ncbi:MAG: NAD-dependent DNA ligase LigA, partial [Proteobacteria bacterium]|nr:NAD-dependent DNA ligase LigA [Pseudomonadota bacterium]NDD05820.1 NAD-dependent DNA ligase LigA [Pseudomonadota bacterium]
MPPSSTKQRIEGLQKEIEEHDYRYYVLDKPIISDEKYDKLFKELQQLEESNPQWASPHSPTQKVGGKPLDKFKKVKHSRPMLSLQNVYTSEEFTQVFSRWRDTLGASFAVVGEPK